MDGVRVWHISTLLDTTTVATSVHYIALENATKITLRMHKLYIGLSNGAVHVHDLNSNTEQQVLNDGTNVAVLSFATYRSNLLVGKANGMIYYWGTLFLYCSHWHVRQGQIGACQECIHW